MKVARPKIITQETLVPAYRCRGCGEIFIKGKAITGSSRDGQVFFACPSCNSENLEEGQMVKK